MSDPGLVLPPLALPPGLAMGPPSGLGAGPPNFDANTAVGALLVGGLISAILFGITSTQSWVYYQTYREDHWRLKTVVATLWTLDTFDMCLIFHMLYWYLITSYSNPQILQQPVWSIILHVLVTSLTETVVRCMFALRIWRLSQNVILVVVVLAVTLTDLVACIMITVKAFYTTFGTLKKLEPLFYLNFSAGLLGDSLVAVSLCWMLHRTSAGFDKMERRAIAWFMKYILNTGLFTAIVASIGLILFAAQPGEFVYIAVYLQLSKLYTNAYLAMLNSRESDRFQNNQSSASDPIILSGIQLSSSLSATHVRSGQDNLAVLHRMRSLTKGDGLDIMVHTEVDRRSDSKFHSQELLGKVSV
ncbi:hypothetical protein BDY19DRAFT_304374 [Irpex rosettiformis]|uniref:Uncharacterized protein n=1 Tax=Irpex rosettiformis TaxID=378272 RepID=A0ACB8TYQ5_9APHY|nr:hypothetical protein BDY19DRAFT_304374 [Irpex rosettiformis]